MNWLAATAADAASSSFLGAAAATGLWLFSFFLIRLEAFGICLFLGDQRLPIRNGDLVIVRVNFREGEKAVAIAAIVHESSLKRRFNPCHLGQIDVPSKLSLELALEIKLLDFVPIYHNDAGFFRVRRVYQHFLWHFVRSHGTTAHIPGGRCSV